MENMKINAAISNRIISALLIYVGLVEIFVAFRPGMLSINLIGTDVPISPIQVRFQQQGLDPFALILGAAVCAAGVILLIKGMRTRGART